MLKECMQLNKMFTALAFSTFVAVAMSLNGIVQAAAPGQPVHLSNNVMKVLYEQNSLSLWTKRSSTPFLEGIILIPKSDRSVSVKDVTHPVWGKGTELSIVDTSGNIHIISLWSSLPFVQIQNVIVNSTAQEMKIAKHELLEGRVHIGSSPGQLVTMSTAGLRPIVKPSGSYAFMAVGDPVSLEGIVVGWLTSERGGGIVFSDFRGGAPYIKARIDYGDLRIPSKNAAETEILMIGHASDVRQALENYADAIARFMKISLPPKPGVYCTWYHAGASDEKKIALNADYASERLKPYGLHVMQIDDYWQLGVKENGPRRNFTDARPDGPYPSGMKFAADYIRAKGFTPGIWFIPFAGSWNDPFWKDRTDLFLKEGTSPDNYLLRMNGAAAHYTPGEAPYEVRWGGTCLDLTNPKAHEYVRSIAHRMSHEWGFKYFKVDGLYTGTGTRSQYINSEYKDDDLGLQIRYDPSITPLEAYGKGFKTLREAAGSDVFILGCCLPQNMRSFSPAMGHVDAMRVGPDNGATPQQLIRGPQFASRVYFLNQRVWYNDPDPVYVRPSFPEEMAKTSVSWVALSGSMHSSSEQYPLLPENRLDILKRSLPAHDLKTVRPVDFLENDPATVWLLTDARSPVRKDVIGLFNWDVTKAVNISYPLNRIDLPRSEAYVGFDYWANRFIPPFTDTISGLLPPGGCKIVSIRPVKTHPQVISTSRHLTQGVVDLSNERWDGKMQMLRGTSEVIAGDAYELRIVVPAGKSSWTVDSVQQASSEGETSSSFTQEGMCVRVTLLSNMNQRVGWTVKFKKGEAHDNAVAVSAIGAELEYDHVVVQWNSATPYQYRLCRNGKTMGLLPGEVFVDKDVQLGEQYTYGIQAQRWNGTWTEISETQIVMPGRYVVPEGPHLPDIYCTNLVPAREIEIQTNKTYSGKPITLLEVPQKNGIGTKVPSTIYYSIPDSGKRFVATIGMDEAIRTFPKAKLVFAVLGDFMEMGEPPVVLSKSPALEIAKNPLWHFDVPLDSRMRQVRLIAEPVSKEGEGAEIEWINAGFVKK